MRPFTQRLIDRTHLSVTVALRVSHTASQSSYVTSHHTQHTQQGAQADEGCEDLVHARLIPTDIQVSEKLSIIYVIQFCYTLLQYTIHLVNVEKFLNHNTESPHLLSRSILSSCHVLSSSALIPLNSSI